MQKVFFISDHFAEKFVGGAEMALEAVIEQCPFEVVKVESENVTENMIAEEMSGNFVVVGNFTKLDGVKMMEKIVEHCKFAIIEYDFKMCGSRNPTLHHYRTGVEFKEPIPEIKAFFEKAECVFFMSKRQMDWATAVCQMKRCEVLSSTFTFDQFEMIERIRKEPECERVGHVIQYSDSTVKGTKQSIEYAYRKIIDYKLLYNLSNEEMFREFKKAIGFIFLPFGEDTCPRTVIEAKLLGCKVIVNSNVLNHDEPWFDTEDHEVTFAYLKGRVPFFWGVFNEITGNMGYACGGAGRECVRV